MAEPTSEHRLTAIHACSVGQVGRADLEWAMNGAGPAPSELVRRVAYALADLDERAFARGRASSFAPKPRREVYGKMSQPIRKLLTKNKRPMTVDEICKAIDNPNRRKVVECCASMASDGYIKRTAVSTFQVVRGKEVHGE